MADDDLAAMPSTWAAYLPLITALVRNVLAVLGGAGFTWALTVNGEKVQMAVTAAMVLAAAGWSFWQKVQATRALRKAAAAPRKTTAPALPA